MLGQRIAGRVTCPSAGLVALIGLAAVVIGRFGLTVVASGLRFAVRIFLVGVRGGAIGLGFAL